MKKRDVKMNNELEKDELNEEFVTKSYESEQNESETGATSENSATEEVVTEEIVKPENGFLKYNLGEDILKSIEMLGYQNPTKVQTKTIPAIIEKKDVIIKSQTGSGKTASFAIPLCEIIDWEVNNVQALVLTPTRELASQVKEEVFNIGRFKRIKVVGLYGGESYNRQVKDLRQKTHIAVGTPGRVLDHIRRETFNTKGVKCLIIDEADEMLNMGFIDEVESIIASLPADRMTVLVSATIDKKINKMINKHMTNPVRVDIKEDATGTNDIKYVFYKTKESVKQSLLRDITVLENPDSCIIFCNTKIAVDETYKFLDQNGYKCNKLHGGMEQRDRSFIMNSFKQNQFRYLVATDVAARGIHVEEISLIINYDMPRQPETFIHRTGRTGRNGNSGTAVTFITDRGKPTFDIVKKELKLDCKLLESPRKADVEKARIEFDKKSKIKVSAKEEKGSVLAESITKIHINAGRKTKMRPADIVGTLCSIKGMSADDIGIISIIDISTYVEVLNGKGNLVISALQKRKIKGRPRTVTKVVNEEKA